VPATEWCQHYLPCNTFSLSNSVCFFVMYRSLRPHQHCSALLVLIRNMGHGTMPKIWVGIFLVRSVQLGGKLWIDSNFKMETRHPVEGPFGSEFPAICNHCGVMSVYLSVPRWPALLGYCPFWQPAMFFVWLFVKLNLANKVWLIDWLKSQDLEIFFR